MGTHCDHNHLSMQRKRRVDSGKQSHWHSCSLDRYLYTEYTHVQTLRRYTQRNTEIYYTVRDIHSGITNVTQTACNRNMSKLELLQDHARNYKIVITLSHRHTTLSLNYLSYFSDSPNTESANNRSTIDQLLAIKASTENRFSHNGIAGCSSDQEREREGGTSI